MNNWIKSKYDIWYSVWPHLWMSITKYSDTFYQLIVGPYPISFTAFKTYNFISLKDAQRLGNRYVVKYNW